MYFSGCYEAGWGSDLLFRRTKDWRRWNCHYGEVISVPEFETLGQPLEGVRLVAQLMCVAARTAPKARGVDLIATAIVEGNAKSRLAARMREIAAGGGEQFFERDASNVDDAAVVILVGTRARRMGLRGCGFCGCRDCQEASERRVTCAFNFHDLGVAVGSAVSIAAHHHVDNRVMFSAGKAALDIGLLPDDVIMAVGIPLSATGKNIFSTAGDTSFARLRRTLGHHGSIPRRWEGIWGLGLFKSWREQGYRVLA